MSLVYIEIRIFSQSNLWKDGIILSSSHAVNLSFKEHENGTGLITH
ncbi:MAG TPA: hypothetical protein VE089_10315 [Nitrososphaeraceae archaeon]|nr:hypothetical protein [Nitrososphaeraceae archaeon]